MRQCVYLAVQPADHLLIALQLFCAILKLGAQSGILLLGS